MKRLAVLLLLMMFAGIGFAREPAGFRYKLRKTTKFLPPIPGKFN